MKLDEEGLTNFSVGRTFQREKRINFLDFSYDGQRLITSGEDDQMVIYDCEKGTEKQVTERLCLVNLLNRDVPIMAKCFISSVSPGGEVSEVWVRPGSLHACLQHHCVCVKQGGEGPRHSLHVTP